MLDVGLFRRPAIQLRSMLAGSMEGTEEAQARDLPAPDAERDDA